MHTPRSNKAAFLACIILGCGMVAGALIVRPWPALGATDSPPQRSIEIWQVEQGLPQNTVQTMLQTSDGYLWIGTRDGLARFDGLRFMIFDRQNTPQMAQNQIRRLKEDRAGRLWICTSKGLLLYANGRFSLYTIKDGLPSDNIWSVYEDRAGSLWIATLDGLGLYRDGKFSAYTTREGLSNNNIETLLEDAEGALWIGTANGLNRFKDGKFSVFTIRNGLAGNAIKALFRDRQGQLWIGTSDGLTRYAAGAFQSYGVRDGLCDKNIETITEDKVGRLWIGTPGGLNLWQFGSFLSYTARTGLPSDRIGALQADREGGLWIGTASGLAYFFNNRITTFTEREGLSSNLILSLLVDHEGNLWAGTETGGLNLLKEKKFNAYTMRQGLSGNLVKAVYEDRGRNLWIATQSGGLDRSRDGLFAPFRNGGISASDEITTVCDDRSGALWIGTSRGLKRWAYGRLTTLTTRDGLPDDVIRSLYEDRAGTLWIGTRRGLAMLQSGKLTSYTMLDGLPADLVGAFCESRAGGLWIGTLGGLSLFRNGKFVNYTTDAGLSSNVILSLYEDAEGSLWIGTLGGGLNRLKDGRVSEFTVREGLADDAIYAILEDDIGFLWMSSNKGIMRVSRKELEEYQPGKAALQTLLTFGPADGMETRECSGGGHPAGWKAHDGCLWFATVKGIVSINPAQLRLNMQPPQAAIEKIMADEISYLPGEPIVVPPGQSRLEFYYTGLSFIAPQKVAFRYKLEGFDPDWIDAGTKRVASYTNLPSGKYRFRVLAGNNDGIWNQTGAAVDFTLEPRFYETWWFYLLSLATIALLGWAWYRARVRRIQREFSAVLAERTRIAREIHDTLAQGFAGISVQLELVARMLAVAPQNAKGHLDQARELVRDSLAEARRSVWDLRSQALEGSDLPAALTETAKRLVANTSVQAQVEVGGTYRRLSRTVEDNLLRIGQEAMTNAIKHARASRLQIDLRFESKRVRFSIRDDGIGFEESKAPETGHFGLIGMRERARQIGGELQVTSRPSGGTEILVEVPLDS